MADPDKILDVYSGLYHLVIGARPEAVNQNIVAAIEPPSATTPTSSSAPSGTFEEFVGLGGVPPDIGLSGIPIGGPGYPSVTTGPIATRLPTSGRPPSGMPPDDLLSKAFDPNYVPLGARPLDRVGPLQVPTPATAGLREFAGLGEVPPDIGLSGIPNILSGYTPPATAPAEVPLDIGSSGIPNILSGYTPPATATFLDEGDDSTDSAADWFDAQRGDFTSKLAKNKNADEWETSVSSYRSTLDSLKQQFINSVRERTNQRHSVKDKQFYTGLIHDAMVALEEKSDFSQGWGWGRLTTADAEDAAEAARQAITAEAEDIFNKWVEDSSFLSIGAEQQKVLGVEHEVSDLVREAEVSDPVDEAEVFGGGDPLAMEKEIRSPTFWKNFLKGDAGSIALLHGMSGVHSMSAADQYYIASRNSLGGFIDRPGIEASVSDHADSIYGQYILETLMPMKLRPGEGHVESFYSWTTRGWGEPSDTFYDPVNRANSWAKMVKYGEDIGTEPEEDEFTMERLMSLDEPFQVAAAKAVANITGRGIYGKLRAKWFNRLVERHKIANATASPEDYISLPAYLSRINGSPWAVGDDNVTRYGTTRQPVP
jgi:hypothetical protein